MSPETPPRTKRSPHRFFESPVPASERGPPLTTRGECFVQINQALSYLDGSGPDECAVWRLCRAVGWLGRDLPEDEIERLILDSLREGRSGEVF